jgi:toxin FitB
VIVLDTNVVSELIRGEPERRVIKWLDSQAGFEQWLTAITVSELLYGVARLPIGRRRNAVSAAVNALIDDDFSRRVLSFDSDAARHYAAVVSNRERDGQPISVADAQIAAICRSTGSRLATRNVRDFEATGIDIVDPWAYV